MQIECAYRAVRTVSLIILLLNLNLNTVQLFFLSMLSEVLYHQGMKSPCSDNRRCNSIKI